MHPNEDTTWERRSLSELEEPSICHMEQVTDSGPDRSCIVRCQDRTHEGFVRIPGYYEAFRGGESIPLYIANNIERKEA